MTTDNLLRLSGFALASGGLMTFFGWILFAILDPDHRLHNHPRWYPLNLLVIVGGLLMAIGLPGFYGRQASEAGIWGLVGFVLLFVGLVLSHIGVHSIETVTMPNIPTAMMRFVSVAAPSLFLGILITGVVTWRTQVYPPSLGIAFILAALGELLTEIRGVPRIIARNLASTLFPASIIWAGMLLLVN